MLKTIVSSYKSYGKNFPVVLLYALPLLVISLIQIYFEGLNSTNRGVKYFIALALFALPIIGAATDVAIYQFILKLGKINPFKSIKTLLIYLFVQIGIGAIAIVPMVLIKHFIDYLGAPSCALAIAVFINIFLGFYFMARFSIVLPLIIQGQKIDLKGFMKLTQRPYKSWLLVAILVYIPYVILYYTIPCIYFNAVIATMIMYVFIFFNCAYLNKTGKVLEPKKATPVTTKPVATKKTVVKKQPAAKKPLVKKPTVKKPVAKKTPTVPKTK